MRVRIEQLDQAVTAALLKIRDGVRATQENGLMCELPGEVQFQVEVVWKSQALKAVDRNDTTSASKVSSGGKVTITSDGETREVATESGGKQITTTLPVTDVSDDRSRSTKRDNAVTNNKDATEQINESTQGSSGQDEQLTTHTFVSGS